MVVAILEPARLILAAEDVTVTVIVFVVVLCQSEGWNGS